MATACASPDTPRTARMAVTAMPVTSFASGIVLRNARAESLHYGQAARRERRNRHLHLRKIYNAQAFALIQYAAFGHHRY